MKNEAEFLHDLASPLATAILMADSLQETVKANPNWATDEMQQVSSLLSSLELIRSMLRERRELVLAQV